MKIEQIEIYPLQAKLSKPFGWSQQWTDARMTTAVKITADDGTYGWGESGDARTMEFLAPLLIGKDPRRTEAIWQMLYTLGYQAHGFAGSQMIAISAFDMALWDIAGKAAGLPVCELLGGSVRDRIPVYATGLYYTEDDFPDALTEEALGYVQAGFTGMKMKIGGKPVAEDIERVYHLRDVLGPQTHLMVDANEAYSPTTAVMVAQKLADADLTWFEEPCGSYNDAGNLLVQQLGLMPIAGGESLKSRYEFAERLASHMFDCTAIGNLGHPLNQDCDTMPIELKGAIRWQNGEDSPPNLRLKLLLRHLWVKVRKQNCVGDTTSATNNYRSGNTNCLTMRRFSLNPLISNPPTLSNGLLNWSSWLGD